MKLVWPNVKCAKNVFVRDTVEGTIEFEVKIKLNAN